jgi:Xaa-Pro aminopeptidase
MKSRTKSPKSQTKSDSSTPHLRRITKALGLLKSERYPAALVVSSNPLRVRSRDGHFPFRQNSDLFYLTGSYAHDLTLVLIPHAQTPLTLLSPPVDKVKQMWEGAQPDPAPLAAALSAKLVVTHDPLRTLLELLRDTHTLYAQSDPQTPSGQLKATLAGYSSTQLRTAPVALVDAEQLTGPLRLYKDPLEVELIRTAAGLTSAALGAALLHIARPGTLERQIASGIEYYYRAHGGAPAFGTIVAAGRSAATLHYHDLNRTLRAGELLLVDTGAELNMYAADVTRTVPVDERTEAELLAVYETVLAAQKAALKAVKPGVAIHTVHAAAAAELTRGLRDLKVLRGNLSQLIKKAAYRPWFPHGIGHSLGIDVHDVGPTPRERLTTLEPGMVVTIEPGLYFSRPAGKVPACGVRIEDDILITSKGIENLTEDVFPKELDAVREALASSAD